MMASLVAPRLWSTDSIVVANGLSWSVACGIFLDQGWNMCLLHWQAESLPLSQQGRPISGIQYGDSGLRVFFFVVVVVFRLYPSIGHPKILGISPCTTQ